MHPFLLVCQCRLNVSFESCNTMMKMFLFLTLYNCTLNKCEFFFLLILSLISVQFLFNLALWKKELLANREALLALDDMRLLSDKNIISRKTKVQENIDFAAGFNQLNGSFRKLEVD